MTMKDDLRGVPLNAIVVVVCGVGIAMGGFTYPWLALVASLIAALASIFVAAKSRPLGPRFALIHPDDRVRLMRLRSQKELVERLVRESPRAEPITLLATELGKLDALLTDFADLAATACRLERHLQTFDFAAMQQNWFSNEHLAKSNERGSPLREIAEKTLEILLKRRARYDDLANTIRIVRGRLDLIEHTFRLLLDDAIAIASRVDDDGTLRRVDEVRVAVDAVGEAAALGASDAAREETMAPRAGIAS
jgi:hypothetical protein